MNTHDKNAMLALVSNLALHFRRTWEDNAQLASLALDWAEDLAGYPLPVVRRAAKLCRTSPGRKTFPTTGEMIAFCDAALGEWRRLRAKEKLLALPDPAARQMSEEQMERNRRRCAELLARLRSGKTIGGGNARS